MKFNMKKAKADAQKVQQKALTELRQEWSQSVPEEGATELQLKHNVRKEKDNSVPFNEQLNSARTGTNQSIAEKILNDSNKRDDRTHNRNAKSQDLVSESYDQEKLKAFRKAQEGQERDTSFWDDFVGDQMLGPKTKIVNNVQESQLPNHSSRYTGLNKDLKKNIKELVTAQSKKKIAQLGEGADREQKHKEHLKNKQEWLEMEKAFRPHMKQIPVGKIDGESVYVENELLPDGSVVWSIETESGRDLSDTHFNSSEEAMGYALKLADDWETEQVEGRASKREREQDLHGDFDGSWASSDKVLNVLKKADSMQFQLFAKAAYENRGLSKKEQQMIMDINSGKARILAKYTNLMKKAQSMPNMGLQHEYDGGSLGYPDYPEPENDQAYTISIVANPDGTATVEDNTGMKKKYPSVEDAKSKYPQANVFANSKSFKKNAQFDDYDDGFPGDGMGTDDFADYNNNEADDYANEGYDYEQTEGSSSGSDLTIEPNERGGFDVYEHSLYEDSSVLAGQPKRVFIDSFQTAEEAKSNYPEGEVIEGTTKTDINMPENPPSWFDPMDAGESWHENDY